MQLSNPGEALIKHFEGLRLSAYRDAAGVWTIGYGSTRYHNGRAVKPSDKLDDEQQANALFRHTLGAYIDAVNQRAHVPLSQNQFDALVSFAYNAGAGAGKTLYEKLNAKDYTGAAGQLLLWDKITDPHTGEKITCHILTKRREQERALFLTP